MASVVGGVCLAPTAALAQTSGRYRLAWARDEEADGCAGGATVAAAVEAILGRDSFDPDAGPSIEGLVQQRERRWAARIVVRDTDGVLIGSRTFSTSAGDCAALTPIAALGVAALIDPDAVSRPRPVEPPTVAPPTVAPPTVVPPTVVSPTVAAAAPWFHGASVALRGGFAGGALPGGWASPQAGLGAEGPASRRPSSRWRWSVRATVLPERPLSRGPEGFVFSSTRLSGGACYDFARGARAVLGACGWVELGALRAAVVVGNPSAPGDQVWAAGVAGLRARLRVWGPVRLEASVDGAVPWVRHRFHDGQGVTVFQSPAIELLGALALGVQIP